MTIIRQERTIMIDYVSSEMFWGKIKDIDSKEINFSSHRYVKSLWSIFFIINSKYISILITIFTYYNRHWGFMLIVKWVWYRGMSLIPISKHLYYLIYFMCLYQSWWSLPLPISSSKYTNKDERSLSEWQQGIWDW